MDLNSAITHMQQQISAAAAAAAVQQQQHSIQNEVKGQPGLVSLANGSAGSSKQEWNTVSCLVTDMLPGYSPWMRNAGRKKSHPVWEFFKDLKDTSEFPGDVFSFLG
ncbi:hypothetical protein TELCIR_23765 [Teladorsagia circumcincta]|uniref:Uncharacterized protein n=1 Tax=Teladorsagia circumcincta TaxID=45464 RepID=A0A2G9TBU3_TELCI|nr:hypothetical protein TELCIR_23765 [Teladorsagia circumcincta]